jgi:hypothetical protein
MLAAVQAEYGLAVAPTFYPWGCDYHDEHGVCAPDDMIEVRPPALAAAAAAVARPLAAG